MLRCAASRQVKAVEDAKARVRLVGYTRQTERIKSMMVLVLHGRRQNEQPVLISSNKLEIHKSRRVAEGIYE
jgi:hypothetical protein